MIQESINQLIGTLGIAYRLSPDFETKAKRYSLQRQEEKLNKTAFEATTGAREEAQKIRAEKGEVPFEHQALQAENLSDIVNKIANVSKERFELDPSSERYKDMLHRQQTAARYSRKAEEKRKLALQEMKEKGKTAVEQAQDFNEHKKVIFLDKFDEPLGGK